MAKASSKIGRTIPKVDEKRLFVDLEVCVKCPECVAKCDYFYHPVNNGLISVRERAAMSVVCRRCENLVCVSACTRDALEKDAEGVLRRYNMRCVGCKSCSIACPFGTLMPEIIPYAVSVCDYCIGRVEGDGIPICVETCPLNAIRFEEVREDISKNNYAVDERLVVHALPWKKEAVTE
ncbi:4Fe-4S binding protein [bacterium]|nr:4Fe-4S binding protein [bacterium]